MVNDFQRITTEQRLVRKILPSASLRDYKKSETWKYSKVLSKRPKTNLFDENLDLDYIQITT